MAAPALTPRQQALRAGRTAFAVVMAVAIGGCNMLLDNQPAELSEEIFAPPPAPGQPAKNGASTEAGRDGGASAQPPSPAPGDPDSGIDSSCRAGTKACGDVCVSTSDTTYGCGAASCGRCAPAHATAACTGGACAIGACAGGFADCNADAADGCETDLTLTTSCGACGAACPVVPGAAISCVAGACTAQCLPGTGDCNGDPSDGCEKNLRKDKANCGQCGRVCLIGNCDEGICRFGF